LFSRAEFVEKNLQVKGMKDETILFYLCLFTSMESAGPLL